MLALNELKNVVVKKPSKNQFIVPSIILIVCIVLGGWLLGEGKKRSIDPPKISFLSPGVHKVNLEEVGTYSIYIESEIQYEGRQYSVPDGSIEKLEIKVNKDGVKIPVRRADIFYTYNKDGNKVEIHSNFDITEPGEYEINSTMKSEQNEEIILSVGIKNQGMLRVLQFTVGASVVILIGVLQFIGYITMGIIKLIMYKRSNHI